MYLLQKNSAYLATVLSEDAGAPELRNPLSGGLRAQGLLWRLLGKKRGR